MIKEEYPLVSVVVITYNSMPYVIDTLNSIKNQTYKNIELIVSDDCSIKDNTIFTVQDWIKKNKTSFVNVKFITSKNNTGVPGNANRGVKAANGVYIKLIAGDDLLEPNCIQSYVKFFTSNSKISIATSTYKSFIEINGEKIIKKNLPDRIFIEEFENGDQFKAYVKYEKNITPPLFYKRELIEKIGWFDEKYKYFEDTPMICKAILNKYKIFILKEDTVLYRINSESITRFAANDTKHFYKIPFVECVLKFKKDIIYQNMDWFNIRYWIKELSFRAQYKFTTNILNNKKNRFTLILYYVFKSLNPYYLTNYFFSRLKR